MQSRWRHLQNKAVSLRKAGDSITSIEKQLGIPRSTLSNWFKDISLTKKQLELLEKNKIKGLVKARKKAVVWHNNQKKERLKNAEKRAVEILTRIDANNPDILTLALAILYLGEGSKKKVETALGSSDPLILKFFINTVCKLFNLSRDNLHCQLNLRADQNIKNLTNFWSKELKIPSDNFYTPSVDKRTIASKTYPGYKGVCQVYCGNSAIQRILVSLSRQYCEKVSQLDS